MEGDRYLSRSALARFLGVSQRTIDRRVADGLLPPPVLIGPPKSKGPTLAPVRSDRHAEKKQR